jgi:hypothetical protein
MLLVVCCRDRLLSSVSLYEIARQAYQAGDYDEAIIALEESLALRLFAYTDQQQLDRWQQALVLPGGLFRRQKMDLANILVLRSDCLLQLAQVRGRMGQWLLIGNLVFVKFGGSKGQSCGRAVWGGVRGSSKDGVAGGQLDRVVLCLRLVMHTTMPYFKGNRLVTFRVRNLRSLFAKSIGYNPSGFR